MKDQVELGDEVVCKITGHKGIVCAIAKHLTGCDRVEVRPPVDKDGKMMEAWWLDINAVKIVKKQKVKCESVQDPVFKGGPPMKSTRFGNV